MNKTMEQLTTRVLDGELGIRLARDIASFLWGERLNASSVDCALEGDFPATVRVLEEALPGWIYRVCRCYISDDAWVMPDYQDPRFTAQFKRDIGDYRVKTIWDVGIDVEIRPRAGLSRPSPSWLRRSRVLSFSIGESPNSELNIEHSRFETGVARDRSPTHPGVSDKTNRCPNVSERGRQTAANLTPLGGSEHMSPIVELWNERSDQ